MNPKINILDSKYEQRVPSPRTKELRNQYGRRIKRASSKQQEQAARNFEAVQAKHVSRNKTKALQNWGTNKYNKNNYMLQSSMTTLAQPD